MLLPQITTLVQITLWPEIRASIQKPRTIAENVVHHLKKKSMPTHEELRIIVNIAREITWAGSGISLREAMNRSRYFALRSEFSHQDLIPILKDDPSLAESWLGYSEDKRTEGGYYLAKDHIGKVHSREIYRSDDFLDLTARYITMELDTFR